MVVRSPSFPKSSAALARTLSVCPCFKSITDGFQSRPPWGRGRVRARLAQRRGGSGGLVRRGVAGTSLRGVAQKSRNDQPGKCRTGLRLSATHNESPAAAPSVALETATGEEFAETYLPGKMPVCAGCWDLPSRVVAAILPGEAGHRDLGFSRGGIGSDSNGDDAIRPPPSALRHRYPFASRWHQPPTSPCR